MSYMKRRIALGLMAALPASAQLDKIFSKLGKKPQGSDTSAAGLKEALAIGTENAIQLIGRPDGFLKNDLIKILMPEKLRMVEKTMRTLGMGKPIDDFELSMNHAAEAAVPLASGFFKSAIQEMTFDDARKIVTGGDTSATDFFKSKTQDKLLIAFRPVIEKAMADNDVTKHFDMVTGNMKKIPFMKAEIPDVKEYVLDKSLSGMFFMIGEEEKKIRKDPAAQVTSLLKEVFGKH